MATERFMRHHYGASGYMKPKPNANDVQQTVERTEKVLGTLISWMANSANSPISHAEATRLLRELAGSE